MAGSGGSLFGMYVPGVPFYCDGTDWNICSGSTIGLMGNKYFCDGYNLDECNEDKVNQYSSDNNYICDGTQWLSIQQTGDLIAPSGYSWDYAPVSTLETPAAQCTNIPENYLGANPSNDLFCCPDASYCPKNDQTLGGDNCFAQNSVVKNSNSDFDLCGYGDEGAEWLKCAPGPLNLQGKVYNDEKFLCNQGWQSCDTEQVMGNNYCSGDKWITCNQSNAGMITPNDQWICNPTGWNSDFVFGSQELYELKIVEDKGGKNFAGVSNFRICEDANLPDLAEVCFNDVSKLPALKTVSKLNKDAEKPFVQNEITYLYESSAEPKTVSAIVTRDVNSLLLDLGNFAKNLNEGRRLMITLDGENYLLSREEGEGFYANLMLTHIPTMQKFPVEILPEGKFQFQVHAGKAIILSLKLLQAQSLIKFEEGVPELAQTAYALPDNLEEIYELPFSKEQPRKLQDFNDMLITVCNNDQSYDPEVLLVCKDNDHFLTLNKSEMTSTVLDYYEGTTNVGKEVGFLYQYVDGKKQGYIFNLQALSKDDSALNYSDFTEALVEGRRIALKFEDALYLLAQPEGDILSLPDMVLESYGGSEVVSTAAAGSTKEVSFLIAEGKITLHRDYATPPPPFQVSALTTLEVISTPVNMEEDLFTVMSSQVPVKLEGVNGLIKASETDFKQDADAFKIVYNNDNKLINLKSPVVFGNNLLYYDSAVIDGGNFIKTMKIYRLYDMDDNNHGEDFHVYDNQFIETFSSGKTLAIKFEDEYFVLGYIGSSESEEAFFSLDDLTLTNLEGSETYEKVVEDVDAGIKQAVFTTTLGKIAIKKDLTKSEIIFTLPEAILAEEDFNPLEDYSIVLKPGMKINVAGETISITETGISQTYINKVNVCGVDDDNDCIFIYKDEPLLLDEMSNQYDLLFWYDPIIEDDQLIEKQVKIYSVIDVSKYIPPTAENLDTAFTFENLFTENSLKEGKTPVLLWNDNYFELHSGLDNAVVDLSTYWLKAIPSGPETTLAMLSDTEGVNNASVYYENNLIFLQQVEKDGVDDIDLNLFSLPYELLTYEGINVTEDKVFTPSVHGNKYVIDAPEIITNLENTPVLLKIVIRNSEDEVVYQTLMPQGVTQEVLLPQGDFMSVGVLSVGLEEEDAVVVISS